MMRVSLKGLAPWLVINVVTAAIGLPTRAQAATVSTAVVQVQNHAVGALTTTPWGVNTAVWDSSLQDNDIPALLKGAGASMLRFPGGSEADAYHWQTNSVSLGGGNFGVDPRNTFDAFMGVAKQAGAEPIITVNYGSNAQGTGGGDPKEAAAWVKYANVTKKYGVKYWEIGNENYGSWETNDHADKSSAAYASDSLKFIEAMKAVDPNIQVGVVLTCPGDGQDPTWNDTVLQTVGSKINFVIVHWYAFSTPSSDDQLLSSTDTIPYMASEVEHQVKQDCGANAKHVQVLVTETNSAANGLNRQSTSVVNALFLANDLMGWLENGVANVDWWDLHNYGSVDQGDYGILDSLENKYPTYYAMALLHLFARPKDQVLQVSSDTPQIHTYAVRRWNGVENLMLVNTNPHQAYRVKLSVPNIKKQTATYYSYGSQSVHFTTSKETIASGTFTQMVQPYSITVISLKQTP